MDLDFKAARLSRLPKQFHKNIFRVTLARKFIYKQVLAAQDNGQTFKHFS